MSKRLLQFGMVLAALMFSILACSFSFSSAKVENLRLAKDKDGAQTTTQYSPQDTFYLVGNLSNAPDDTLLKAIWTAIKAEGVADNSVVKEFEARGGSGNFWFELTRDGNDWPRGQYKVDLFMNDELNQTLNFDVVGPEPTPTPQAALETEPVAVDPQAGEPLNTETVPVAGGGQAGVSNLHATKDEGDTQPAAAFAQLDEMYAHFSLDTADGQANVHGALIAVAVEGLEPESLFTDLNESFPAGAQWIRFSNTNPWPLGRYRIEVTANDAAAQSVDVEVVSTNTSGAQIQNVYASLDKEGQQPASTFPTGGSVFVQFTLASAPPDTDVKGVMIARDVTGMDPNTHVTDAGGQLGDGSYWFEFFNDGPWPVGSYTIYIYLNGQYMQQVEVQVSE